jgi:hypothetical protein
MRGVRPAILVVLMLATTAVAAQADATLFLGASTTPANRMARGAAIGIGLLVVGFDFEYSATTDDVQSGAPSLKVGSANGLLQTPVAIGGFQPYVTAGAGVFHEHLGEVSHTGFAPNFGGGVKVDLIGPVRLRVDYRVFKPGSGAQYTPSHRFYAGLNLKF